MVVPTCAWRLTILVPATMCTLGERAFVIQNREMNALRPQPTGKPGSQAPLRVRKGPLLRWFFVGFLLFAEVFLASRVWAGWRPPALARVFAVQIFFAPRLMLFSLGFALFATLLAERMVHWIARPMTSRWLSPTVGLPPESELPLYLKMGETIQKSTPARHKTEHGWEPGWLILTDQRLFWLSGIWRSTTWELDRIDPEDSITDRLELGPVPRWLGGYVVGMPPRLIVHLSPTAYAEDGRDELVALAHPHEFLQLMEQAAQRLDQPEPVHEEPVIASVRAMGPSLPANHPLELRNVSLPPRRQRQPRPEPVRRRPPVERSKPIAGHHPLAVRGVTLPPRRQNS